jgi:hypothetical protein
MLLFLIQELYFLTYVYDEDLVTIVALKERRNDGNNLSKIPPKLHLHRIIIPWIK